MVRLICRAPSDHWPSAQEAQERDISAWLIPVTLDGDGQLLPAGPADGPADLLFCLEWQLPHPLSPNQQRKAAQQLRPWLNHPLQLRWRGQRVLWIARPERLSHPHWATRQLQLALGNDLLLWGRGPAAAGLQGCYEQPLQDWRCRRVNGEQHDYESYLFHAHHRSAAGNLVVPAVQPWTPALEHSHVNSGAEPYNEWLRLACAWAELRHAPDESAWVLVEDWEGHRRWWRPAPPLAQHSSPCPVEQPAMQQAKTADPRPALVVHGYHLEALEELLSPLCGPDMALYLSTPAEQVERAERICRTLGWREAEVVPAENRGRDMAPFVLDLLPRVLANGHPWLLKLHTKRSDHLDAGRAWAAHLQGSLASAATCRSFGDWFRTDPTAGLLAAPGTLLPSTISLDRNVVHLRWLLDALELPTAWWLDQPFVAGSMYAVRSAALAPLLTLQLNRDQFEAEQGQRDGTLAHALERLVAALVIRQGFTLRALSGDAQAVPPFGYGWAAPA